MMAERAWNEAFGGFHIYDCAVRSKYVFSFICVKDMEGDVQDEPDKRMVKE